MNRLEHMLLVASTSKALARGKPVTAQHLMVANELVKRSPRHALIAIREASRSSGLFDALKKGFGVASKITPVLSPTTALAIQAMKYANARKAARPATISDQTTSSDIEHLMGVGRCGEEEAALAASGGNAERNAFMRGRGKPPFYFPSFITAGVPNDVYRAAIWQRACRLSRKTGNKHPAAKHLLLAQKATDWDLRRKGISVSIPGARPGRRTR